jgi:hypothetical protein
MSVVRSAHARAGASIFFLIFASSHPLCTRRTKACKVKQIRQVARHAVAD